MDIIPFSTIYENHKSNLWLNNISSIQKIACGSGTSKEIKNLNNKIKRHLKKTGIKFTEDDILKKIQNDQLTASFFCKDPKRQNLCENIQFKYIKYLGLNISKNECKLKDCKYNIKKTDALFGNIHCSLKHIDEKGGAQDNQYNDILNFSKEFEHRKTLAYVIVSGKYFTPQKINKLKNEYCHTIYLSDKDLVKNLKDIGISVNINPEIFNLSS